MDSIRSWMDDERTHQMMIVGAITLLALAVSKEYLKLSYMSIARMIPAVSGRLHVKQLKSAFLKSQSQRDATISGIFVYPGELATELLMMPSILFYGCFIYHFHDSNHYIGWVKQ